MTADSTAPIRKSVSVPLSPEAAFTLFTEKMDSWWPLDQKSVSVGKGLPPSRVLRVDPHPGGQVTEVMVNGEEEVWGEILDWVPGARFRMTWRPGRAAATPTEVDVTFSADAIGCRVVLVHSGFDAHANGAELKAMYSDGWEALVRTLFARAAGALQTA